MCPSAACIQDISQIFECLNSTFIENESVSVTLCSNSYSNYGHIWEINFSILDTPNDMEGELSKSYNSKMVTFLIEYAYIC